MKVFFIKMSKIEISQNQKWLLFVTGFDKKIFNY